MPDITKNLISISKLVHYNNVYIEFNKTYCVVKDKRRENVLRKGVVKDRLYKLLNLAYNHSQVKLVLLSSTSTPSLLLVHTINNHKSMMSVNSSNKDLKVNKILDLLHIRLDHLNIITLRKTLSSCNISFENKMFELSSCEACQYGKLHRLHLKIS